MTAWVQLLSLMGICVCICRPEEEFYLIIILLSYMRGTYKVEMAGFFYSDSAEDVSDVVIS